MDQDQEVMIGPPGVPIARLVPWIKLAQPVAATSAMPGQIKLADDVDAPLDGLNEALR